MKKCRLPKTPADKIDISLDGKFLTEVLKRVDSVTRFSESADALTHSHLLVTYMGDVFVIGRTPDTFVCHIVNGASSSGDTAFNIDPKSLMGLISKRGALELNYTHPQVFIKEQKGRYKSDFKVKQLSPEQIPMVEEGLRHHIKGGHEMGREVIDAMTEGVKATRIKDPITNEAVICRVDCDGKKMQVTSPGDWTSARFITKIKKACEPFRFSLTGEMFDLVSKFCGNEKVTFHVDTSAFAAEAESFVVTLPPIQSSDEDYRFIENTLQALGKPVTTLTVNGDLSAPFANIATLVDGKGNTNATLMLKKKEFRLKFGNDAGNVQDSLTLDAPVPKEFKTLLDMRIMRELLKNIGKQEQHLMGFHGQSLNDLNAFTLKYDDDKRQILYFGYIPS